MLLTINDEQQCVSKSFVWAFYMWSTITTRQRLGHCCLLRHWPFLLVSANKSILPSTVAENKLERKHLNMSSGNNKVMKTRYKRARRARTQREILENSCLKPRSIKRWQYANRIHWGKVQEYGDAQACKDEPFCAPLLPYCLLFHRRDLAEFYKTRVCCLKLRSNKRWQYANRIQWGKGTRVGQYSSSQRQTCSTSAFLPAFSSKGLSWIFNISTN